MGVSSTVDNRIPGLMACGVHSAKNFQYFLQGVELHCQGGGAGRGGPLRGGRAKRPAVLGLDLSWVHSHMAQDRGDDVIEQARGTAMRTLLNACILHGTGFNATQAKALLARYFGLGRYVSCQQGLTCSSLCFAI